jgi:hypothetical protein
LAGINYCEGDCDKHFLASHPMSVSFASKICLGGNYF